MHQDAWRALAHPLLQPGGAWGWRSECCDGERASPIQIREDIRARASKIADFCRRNHIRKLALFGSILTEDFRPDSDVDVLVEFEPGARVGLITFAGIQLELSELLGREVDLHTAQGLSRYFRDEVVSTAEALYEE